MNRNLSYFISDAKLLHLLNEKWLEENDPEYGGRIQALLVREYNNDY